MKIGLVGPSYQMRSLPFDAQRTINLYPIADETGKETVMLYETPGLILEEDLGNGPGRKCFSSANGRAFVVSGSVVFEKFDTGDAVAIGNVGQSSGNLSMAENDTQLGICDGEKVYIFTYADDTYETVTGTGLPARVSYLFSIDGYFIAIEADSGRFYKSALGDGLTWDALDFATAESNPDQLFAGANSGGQMFLFGGRSFEIWSNTGAAAFPFQRIAGAVGTIGIVAPHSLMRHDNVLFWVGKDENGGGSVYRTQGFRPQKISTEAMDIIIQSCDAPEQISGFIYQQDGHVFYIITGGGLPTSLAFDLTTGLWHERAFLNEYGQYEPHLAADCMYAFGRHICCDRRNGALYELSLSEYSDAGSPLVRERIYTHLSDENKYMRYSALEIGVEMGTSQDNSEPLISLSLSTDGARTWSDWFVTGLGKTGEYRKRAIFRRLGTAEQMTFRIRISGAVKVAITGSYLR